jgi:hypothetical protein
MEGGDTGVISFGYTGFQPSAGQQITIEVDLSGVPAGIQTQVNPVIYGNIAQVCAWWSGHGGFTCVLDSAHAGIFGYASGALNFTAPVGMGGTTGSYRVRVSGQPGDPNLANNTATRSFRIISLPSSDVTVHATPAEGHVGENVVVGLNVRNLGPDLTFVQIDVAAPTGATFHECRPMNCNAGPLHAGEAVDFEIEFRITGAAITGGSWSDARAADRPDPNPSNNALPPLASMIHVLSEPAPANPAPANPAGASGGGTNGNPVGSGHGVSVGAGPAQTVGAATNPGAATTTGTSETRNATTNPTDAEPPVQAAVASEGGGSNVMLGWSVVAAAVLVAAAAAVVVARRRRRAVSPSV